MERTLILKSANLVLSLDPTTVLFQLVLSSFSHVQLFATPWTVAHQAPLCMGFSRQEYRSGLPFPPPEDLLDPGIEPGSLTLQVDSLPLNHQRSPISYRTQQLLLTCVSAFK